MNLRINIEVDCSMYLPVKCYVFLFTFYIINPIYDNCIIIFSQIKSKIKIKKLIYKSLQIRIV